ncbi:MAG: hypothetical protein R6U58_13290, partial [Bacteroidales bacterium]
MSHIYKTISAKIPGILSAADYRERLRSIPRMLLAALLLLAAASPSALSQSPAGIRTATENILWLRSD